ncbi:Lipocalin-like domain-containing protein [Maribacter orientalis]|uniref:Lipocalin-like domain-containing protein n=1 Tax=Maribacter orientalis TaxID=228957 RepID=A0A1H7R100_9FLAO|nr:lipocalin family protein [Maribacter orientalis]SEL53843.1 Lipocalin-like domain-containing protein [Maribacter orientalis]|tara:strand:+ start:2929 stop:3435 length:507 start_codon:yes stop_codon:yes gene_type:complete
MYKHILFFLGMALVLISCSSDKNDSEAETQVASTAILGTWDATELVIDDATASDNTKFAKGILDLLTDKDCYVVTLTFNEDLTASASNSANYVEVNATGTGLDIPCPTESDIESSTYTFDGTTVTTTKSDGEVLNITVSIDGDIMTVDAADLKIPNFSDDGQMIFVKR